MKKLGGKFVLNGFQNLQFRHGFQCLLIHSTTTSSNDSFANYLVSSLGFSHEQALSTSTKRSNRCNRLIDLKNISKNANSVVNFFKNHVFDETLIRKVVSSNPKLLSSKVKKTLKPKFDFLKNEGFSRDDIIRVFSGNPNLLSMGLDSSIAPAVQIFRGIMICDDHVIAILKKMKVWGCARIVHHLLPNVDLLSSYGISIDLIRKHLLQKPLTFLRKPETFKDIVIRVEERLGINRESPMFMYGIHLASSFSEENIESKFFMLKRFGWTQSDIATYIMKNAGCFTVSEASIEKKMEFLMNEVGLDPAYLTTHTSLLTCSLEKRVMPRHKVLSVLKEKGLMEKTPTLDTAVRMSEPNFLTRFVLPFEQVHKVYAKHTGCSMKTLVNESADTLL
ncbi:hypothetical protein RND81_10G016000 [Saponaria officinalis]|uniref:Uncharacterized protein n=1 Tax=Saponaria officinalis TaxID=3572 RepID=A0AAW1HXS3_SAPOF